MDPAGDGGNTGLGAGAGNAVGAGQRKGSRERRHGTVVGPGFRPVDPVVRRGANGVGAAMGSSGFAGTGRQGSACLAGGGGGIATGATVHGLRGGGAPGGGHAGPGQRPDDGRGTELASDRGASDGWVGDARRGDAPHPVGWTARTGENRAHVHPPGVEAGGHVGSLRCGRKGGDAGPAGAGIRLHGSGTDAAGASNA